MRRSSMFCIALALTVLSCAPKEDAHDHGGTSSTSSAGTTATAEMTTGTMPADASSGPLVTWSSLGGTASGYLATPRGDGAKRPAVIVIQEWWGLDDWVRQQADHYAQQGYVALAVDLYRGKSATTMEEAHELSRALPEDRAVADLKSAFAYLAARSDVEPGAIGTVGWCLGGGYALALAVNEPRLAAAAMNYGRLVTDPATVAKIAAPLLGNFGGADRGIPVEDVKKFEAAMKSAGKTVDIKIYEGARHAFMNPNNEQGYDAAAAADAQARIDRWFAEKLHAKIPNR